MFHDKMIAAIRTLCAVLGTLFITWVVGLLTGWGFKVELDESWTSLMAGLLFAFLVSAYNYAVAWLTEHVWLGFGWLLGVNKPPSYITDLAGDLLPEKEQAVATPPGEPDTVEWVDPHAAR